MRARLLRDRRQAGHGALAWDPALAAVARDHSRDMARRGYLGHVSPEGDGPNARLRHAGYAHRNVRENVARAPTVGAAEDGFLASPHHRENLMADDVTRFGIGIVRGAGGREMLYVTQLFATPYVPPAPEAVARALLEKVRAVRERAGAPRLRPLAVLSAVARRHVVGARAPLTREALLSISREAMGRSGADVALATVSVSTQTVLEAADLDIPPPALRPAVRYAGVAAARIAGEDGQPSVLVLLLVAEAAP
ncbi:MAG TPA: CAP domain-containing protein [Gemmatimonadota bacterium]|nr:CAP domain-containing protein [Gemmatimonadota bacterium]